MVKIKITCPGCGRLLQCDEPQRGEKIRCPHCRHSLPVKQIAAARAAPANRRRGRRKWLAVGGGLLLVSALAAVWFLWVAPVRVQWPDRRPIGVLFLASNHHSSATNPRGWFNDPALDVTGADGRQRFRQALLDYADRSIAILKRTGAQGVIVWDLEGEQYPHKTSFIGDPRLLDRLAPEMAPVADEFFARLRGAGLRVGLTIRPQELIFDDHGQPRQTEVLDIKRSLLGKIDYARSHWEATLFYIDSNGGIRRPDEVWQLRRLVAQRPGILLMPEHDYLPYWAFSAPYAALRNGGAAGTAGWARKLFPGSFQVLDVSDAAGDWGKIDAARRRGDVLLFRAWFWNPECQLLENFAHGRQ